MVEIEKRWINEQVASEITGLAVQTLRNYRHLGIGPAYTKKRRIVRYLLDDIYKFMESGRVETDQEFDSIRTDS